MLNNSPKYLWLIFFEKISSRVPVCTVLTQLHEKEKNKKKKERISKLFLTEEEKETLPEIVKALDYVKIGSTRLCKNNLTLSTADRVRCKV